MTINYKTHDNGLTIASDKMEDIETVSVHVHVKTGSRNEKKEENGVSHFLEHMAFKGTEKRTAKQIALEFDNMGASFNAYTSREKTAYYAKVLKEDLPKALDILSDIAQNSILPKDELEIERGVILQEIAMTEDTPDDIIWDHFQETAYPDQPFGRTILGPKEIIKNITQEEINNYIERQYSLPNVIVSAAGNINVDEFEKLTEDKFSNLPTHNTETPAAANYKGGDFRHSKDLEQIQLLMGFKGLSLQDDNFYHQQILASIFGGSMSSRLNQEIREKRGLVYSVYSFGMAYSDNGMFGIYAATSDEKVNELVEVTCAEIKKLTNTLKTEELNRAKTQVKTGLMMSRESSVSRAEKLAGNLSIFGRYITPEETLKEINKITLDDLQVYAKNILDQKDSVTVASLGKIDKLISYEDIVNKL